MKAGRISTICTTSLALVGFNLMVPAGNTKPRSDEANMQAQRPPPETFAYQVASDRNIRVSVDSVAMRGDEGFMPKNANWIQLHVTVTNLGPNTLSWSGLKARLADGTVLATASSAEEIKKPPSSMTSSTAKALGLGVGGQMVGMFLFPPAALIAGVAGLFGNTLSHDRSAKLSKQFGEVALHDDVLAPQTSMKGLVFVPAVSGQTGLIAFYANGTTIQSLPIHRVSSPVPAIH